ncbi:globin domain-containing protein [Actinomadura rupiterrae]|uniref:globin domain-containing protein n=1 Tax=Actinomadura rupiterrae TaxID=559627 RepID=UPI0020A2790D|nr:globin domain-containing protein [Actinomadura rupiterrae]MCP2342314.1 NAD(P)H-flavin reductase [Actinomadura rupiterrae]
MSLEPRIVKESFTHIEPDGERATAYFYGRLFAENPRLRTLFPPAMDLQRDRLFHALTTLVWSLDSPDSLAHYLSQLGRDHRKFGVRPEHYPAVGAALLATLRRFSGDAWTAETEAAWTGAFGAAAEIMIAAAERDASDAPPWWVAEVVEHERRAPDIAVLTLRPSQPLRFAAGQYITVQTARWPRVWRPYSIANAPRADGMLRLHVRAVPGGWVSGTLVRHTTAGDTVLLGPALGAMTLPTETPSTQTPSTLTPPAQPRPTGTPSGKARPVEARPADSGRDLLLVAGGTGLAPLKAIAEQAASAGGHREVHLLFAARTERDLYDLAELRLLESSCPRLRVVPVLSDDPRRDGPVGAKTLHGTAAEVLDRFRDWSEHEAYVAGPPAMIRTTTAALERLGVPPERIHHDLLETEQRERLARRARDRTPPASCPVAGHAAPREAASEPEPEPAATVPVNEPEAT